jgi:hypothetical protein
VTKFLTVVPREEKRKMAGVINKVGEATRQVAQRMGEAAANFLAALSPDQRAKAQFALNEEGRTVWHYTPIPRAGLPLTQMDRPQQQLAQKLVASGLSEGAYGITSVVMGLENTLDMREGWKRPLPGRDSRLYYVRIFGEPGNQEPWGWSFEGHHISLNYTIAKGEIIAPTPTFFGSNPAESLLGGHAKLRPLQGIEDLARDLMHTLDEGQRAHTIIAHAAPPDIVTTNRAYLAEGDLLVSTEAVTEWQARGHVHDHELEKLRYSSTPQGIASGSLNSSQQELLMAVVAEYIHRMPDELAEIEMQKLQASGAAPLYFAWAGGLERGQGHYYRIQGGHFLAEYDNTQDNANHIHSVWRDPHNDFGADILAQHYAHSHRH